jgi:hypothetical protein
MSGRLKNSQVMERKLTVWFAAGASGSSQH